MAKVIHAIYKNGILKPLKPLKGIKENTQVAVTISLEKERFKPFAKFAGTLSEKEAEEMMKLINDEFEKINSDEWKN